MKRGSAQTETGNMQAVVLIVTKKLRKTFQISDAC